MGLDQSKLRCFRCNRLGHVIRNCPEPRTNTVRIEEVKAPESSNAVAQYATNPSPSALQVTYNDEGVPDSVNWDAITTKLTVSSQPTSRDGNLSTFMATIEYDDVEAIPDNVVEAVSDEIVSQQMANEEEEALKRQLKKETEEVTEKCAAVSLEEHPESSEKALMAKPESKVCVCDSKICVCNDAADPPPCPKCFTLNDRLIIARQQEQEARRELQQNLNTKDNEKQLLLKIKAQQVQIHDLHAHLSLRQKDCTAYLEEIADLKRENTKVTNDLSSLKVEYDILQSKVANYSCSARILNSIEVKHTGNGSKSYNYVDRPYDFTMVPELESENDHDVLGPMPPPPVPLEQDKGIEKRPKTDKSVLGPMPPPSVPLEQDKGVEKRPKSNSGKGKLKMTIGLVTKSDEKQNFEKKEMDTSASTSGPKLPKNYVSLNDLKRKVEEDKAKGLETGIIVPIGKTGPKMGGLGYTNKKTDKLVWKQTGMPVKSSEEQTMSHIERSKPLASGKPMNNPRPKVQLSPPKRQPTCYECGAVGHVISACPNLDLKKDIKPSNRPLSPLVGKDKRTCYKCGQVGHVVYKCPTVPKPFLRDESPKKLVRHHSPEKVTTVPKNVWVSKGPSSPVSKDKESLVCENVILKKRPVNDMNHQRLNNQNCLKQVVKPAIKATI